LFSLGYRIPDAFRVLGIAAVASPFVRGVLGPDWVTVITALQLLAAYGLFASLTSVYYQLWMA